MLGVRNVDAVIARLARTGESRFAAVKRALLAEIAAVQVRVRAALDGGMLQSPRLRDAITVAMESDGTRVTATLSIDGVPYAAIQEYGGTSSDSRDRSRAGEGARIRDQGPGDIRAARAGAQRDNFGACVSARCAGGERRRHHDGPGVSRDVLPSS